MYSSQEFRNARPLLRSPLNSLGGDGLTVVLLVSDSGGSWGVSGKGPWWSACPGVAELASWAVPRSRSCWSWCRMVEFCAETSESFSSKISIRSPNSVVVALFMVARNGDSGAVSTEELSFSDESSPTPKLPIVALGTRSGLLW